jgi:hypothetical protein
MFTCHVLFVFNIEYSWTSDKSDAQIRRDYAAAESAFNAILVEDPEDREVKTALQLMQKEKEALVAPVS